MSNKDDSGQHTLEAVDQEARSQIDRLRRRIEGAHLVPSIWVLFKQMFQSVIQWGGWEVFGIGFFILLGLAILTGIISITHRGCTSYELDLQQRNSQLERERFGPACEALGLTYTRSDANHVVCTGPDRVVTINTNDIDESEVHMIGDEHE